MVTEHSVVNASKRRIREVRCEACGFAHKFSDTAAPRKISSKMKGKESKETEKKSSRGSTSTAEWKESIESKKHMEPVNYRMGGSYAEGMLIQHPKFGLGVVKKVISENKIEALFKEGLKTLVQKVKK